MRFALLLTLGLFGTTIHASELDVAALKTNCQKYNDNGFPADQLNTLNDDEFGDVSMACDLLADGEMSADDIEAAAGAVDRAVAVFEKLAH